MTRVLEWEEMGMLLRKRIWCEEVDLNNSELSFGH